MAFSLVTEQAQTVLDLGEFIDFPNPYMVGNPIIIEDGSSISIDIPPTDLHIIYKNENHEFREDFVQWNGGTFTLSGKKIVYSMYGLDNTEELAFRLVWDGVGYPWDGISGEEVTVVGEIRPLQKVLRVDGAHTHIYRLDEGAKLTFPDAPAGTLEVTKAENNIVTTTQTSFSGGTLELTDKEILDAKIVDEEGNTLFQLGKKVGDSIFDAVEPTRIGTVEGNVSNVKDVGWGMVFDGVDDYIEVIHSDSLNISSKITMILSFCVTVPIEAVFLVEKGTSGYLWGLYVTNASSRTNTYIVFGDGMLLAPGYDTAYIGKWFHLVGTYGGSYVKHYVNAMLRQTADAGVEKSIKTNEESVIIGGWYKNSRFFKGGIDEVRIYNRALSPSEISLLTQGRYDEVSKEGLVLWVTVDPKTGDIIDRSPYRHTVTLYGGVETKLVALA